MNDELEKLRKENDYLKKLLKLNGIEFENREMVTPNQIDTPSKLKIFMSYFTGRKDIIAEQYTTKDGKIGYSPVCLNKFNKQLCDYKCSLCKNKKYDIFDDKKVLSHMKGEHIYGIYPLLDDDLTYFLAVDFDEEERKKDALEYKKECISNNIDCVIEISQSGEGAHAYIFFEKATKAKIARRIGDYLLSKIYSNDNQISVSSFDRFFPSQDTLPINGYGNLICLPLSGKRAKEQCTLFVDMNFIPYDSQISYLSTIRKMKEIEVNALYETIKESNDLLISTKRKKKISFSKNDIIGELDILVNNQILISKSCLSNKAKKTIKYLGSVPNIEFYKLERLRKSTYNTQRFFQLFKEDNSFFYLPRGCLDELLVALNNSK